MPSMQQIAMQLIQNRMQQDPKFANNQNMASMIDVIRTGDNAKGEQLANNILQTMGVSKEEGIQRARSFFGL